MVDLERVRERVGDEVGLRELFIDAAVAERKMPRAYDLRVRGYWPEVPGDKNLAYGYGEVDVRPGPASVREVGAWDMAIELTAMLEPDDAKLVWAAAHSAARRHRGPAWRRIAEKMHCHPQTAKRRFDRAILGLWYKILYGC